MQQIEQNPITPPPTASAADRYLVAWLRHRLGVDRQGNRGRLIYATGSVNANEKYRAKPVGYQPDLLAYLAGDVGHIYGSWLRGSLELTYVLAFDLDEPKHHARHQHYMEMLAAAGAPSIYWQRGMDGRQRGHLECYFDRPVDPDRARAWSISMCPELAEITECFPAGEKRANALSWPLYQRIGDQVRPCLPLAQICVGEAVRVNVRDRRQLASLIQRAVIPATQIEAFKMPVRVEEKLSAWSGERQEVRAAALSDHDVMRQIIADFHMTYSWEEVTASWGGVENGRFRNGERGERTASVVIDRDGQYACDYGDLRNGRYPRKLDKYEVWCRANRINKKVDLDERCKEYRRRLSAESCTAVERQGAAQPFQVGDAIIWKQRSRGGYGYIYPVDGEVVEVGTVKVTIRVLKKDGTEATVAVQSANLVRRTCGG